MQKHKKILFLTLNVFSATGGIEKVCRIAGKALYESDFNVNIFSMHDNRNDFNNRYFPVKIFSAFDGKKINFILKSISTGVKQEIIIMSHINLLIIGCFIKLLSPKTKIILLAHGVEIWQPLSAWKIKMLQTCDSIFAVSTFTKKKLKELYNIDSKCMVLNNCLDPFLPKEYEGNNNLYHKYNLSKENFILITVTRISATEQYKGHEKVIESINRIIKQFPELRYIIAGKYDLSEKERLEKVINHYNLNNKIFFTGFIPDDELPGYYNSSDLFIMPSKGEGFGIVFIEAMNYGLPVIAGNKDGATDALCNGKLGLLVDPENVEEISAAITKVIQNKLRYVPNTDLLIQKFSYPVYKENLKEALDSIYAETNKKIA
jgi:Glycosyltransferase